MNCKEVVERLPWYLTGTLEGDEAVSIVTHMEGCDACRRGAEATLQTLTAVASEEISADTSPDSLAVATAEHLPSDALLEMAWCEAGCARPEQLRHLARCGVCRDAVTGARESRQLRFSGASNPRDGAINDPVDSPGSGSRFRNALAAAVVLLSVLMGLQQVSIQRGARVSAQPSTGATIVDLFSDESMERSSEDPDWGRLNSDEPILLLLHPSRSAGPFDLKLLDADGKVLFEAPRVELLPTGDVTLSLPRAFLGTGSYSAVLGAADGEPPSEVFRFTIESPIKTNGAQ